MNERSDNIDIKFLRVQLAEKSAEIRRLKSSGGDDTSGGMSDDWKTSVDTQLGQLHSDVRLLIGAGIAALLVSLGAIAGSHMALSNQVTSAQVDIGKLSARLDAMDKRLDSIDAKLDKLLDAKSSR